jgi:predicted secreted protein
MKAFVPLLLPILFFISCDYKKIDSSAPAVNTIKNGEKFYIQLPEDHTNGYMWQLSNAYDNTALDYLGSVFHGNEKGVYFNFAGGKPGKTTLNFTLIKYHDTTDVRSYVIEVK